MTIAIAVVIKPSNILRNCLTSFACLLVLTGIYIAFLPNYSVLIQTFLMGCCAFAVWCCFSFNRKFAQISWRVVIDNQGKLWCQLHSSASTSRVSPLKLWLDGAPANLVKGTTIWPHALFLCLHCLQQNTKLNVVVLSDSLSKDEFRRLSIACKWIVNRANSG